ncbi:hypothetical protein [Actinoplanes subglobosus]|uniref:Uncharacterized protein n=1 Tax=Actinoplanes subglobosus TaxID=1547892 RepID=A0ABV8J1H5_9ACTN
MNVTRVELPPMPPTRIVYPSLGRSIIDSSITVGRTVLVTGAALGILIGFSVVIALALTTGAGVLGYDASASY